MPYDPKKAKDMKQEIDNYKRLANMKREELIFYKKWNCDHEWATHYDYTGGSETYCKICDLSKRQTY